MAGRSHITLFGLLLLSLAISSCSSTGVTTEGTSAKKVVTILPPDHDGPEVIIVSPRSRGLEVVHRGESLVVKGQVFDPSGVARVTVNGERAAVDSDNGFSVVVELAEGDNTITVQAFDRRDNLTTKAFTVERSKTALTLGNYYALLIGIDEYDGAWPRLGNAVGDAKELAAVLTSQYQFDAVETLFDEDATRENIIKKLEWLESTVTDDDNVLIYYAGHGDLRENRNRGYWVPVDAKTKSTAHFISNADIQSYVRGIRSKHTLLIVDACFAGDLLRGGGGGANEPKGGLNTAYFQEVYGRKSRQVITSGGLEPVMDGGQDGHSVFAYNLLRALKDRASDFVDAGELFNDMRIPIMNNSSQVPQFNLMKNTGDEGGQFVFIRK